MAKNLKILRPILVVLILFIPLYPKFPLVSVTGTHVAIRLDDIVVSLSLLALFINQAQRRFPIFKKPITKLFLAYFLAVLASAFHAALVYQTTPTNLLLLHSLRRLEYLALFFLTIEAVKTKKDLFFPYLALLFTAILIAVYGYGQRYWSFPVVSTMNQEFAKGQLLQIDFWSRISATFAGHYDLAAYQSLILIIIGSVFLLTKNKALKIISLLVWAISFHILSLTASRVSTFAFWAGFTFTLILIRKYLAIIPFSILMFITIFVSPDLSQRLIATLPTLPIKPKSSSLPSPKPTPTLAQKPSDLSPTPGTPHPEGYRSTPTIFRHQPKDSPKIDIDAGVARSGQIRFNAEWPRAITAYKKNPILGTGPGSITLATDNDYLRALGETGLFGLVSFFAIPFFLLSKTVPLLRQKKRNLQQNLPLVFAGVTITMLLNATLIDVFEASKIAYSFWIIAGIFYQSLKFSHENKT